MQHTGFPPAMRRLVNELTKLPSIGEKSALRLAYHLLSRDESEALHLADAIREAREKTHFCRSCFALSEEPLCSICADPGRQRTLLCVVEKPADVIAVERSGGYHGLYHVLHGLWSPLRGVGPEQTRIGELLQRLTSAPASPEFPAIEELLLATSTLR